jgi:hypothetical protein
MFSKKMLFFCLLLLSLTGNAQQFTVFLANQSSTSTTFEVDLMIVIPEGGRRLTAVSAGINYNPAILNGGTPCTTAGCGSWSLVANTIAPEILANGGLNSMTLTNRATPVGHLRIVQVNKATSLVDLPAGTYRCGRFRFTNTVAWTSSSNANLWLSNVGAASTNTIVSSAPFGAATPITNLTATTSPAITLTHTATNTFSVPLNFPSCATVAEASNLVAESPCAGAANGSALITLSAPTPADAAITYTVDGGATQNANLVGGTFTVSGLAAGDHTVAVTYGGSCTTPVTTSSFTIGAGAPLTTNGSVSTSICEGQTYVWPANGLSYTTAQENLQFVDGCNTATLNLAVTPATTTGSVTTSICEGQTYVWPANGQSYTTAQSGVTFVDGCNIATLNLTVNPVTTTGSESVTACGSSYTWPVSGQTYNASGSYDFVSGCNTATLTLTLNTSAEVYYADTDGDGFGAGAAIESCTGQPANTSVNNTDCAPENPLAWRTGNFFVDADGDGYNNGFPAAPVCYGALTPAGYVAVNNGTDCNDELATVNSNASEVLGNGIDDNCDGSIDEVTPLSSLIASSCGVTLTNLSNTLFAYPLSNFIAQVGQPQGYRFRVTNGATVRFIDTPTNSFTLTSLVGGAAYATTYTVEVSVKTQGYYRAYGPACTVTTPAVPNSTSISNPSCGSTLSSITTTIFCTPVASASGYRFRVRNGATLVGTYDSAVNRFSLTNLGISNIAFGTTYTVDVLLAFGGNFRPDSEYGDACSITTPATPATSRVIQPTCGSSISNLWTTIFAQQVIGAQGYKFVVTNGAQTREFSTPNPRFSLQNLAGGAAANTVYTIRVDVLYASSYVQGTVLCTITTTPGATRQTASALDIYEVKAYPNPYADTFKLDVNTSSENQVGVRVYDMLGREVEARQSSVSDITNVEIGSQYPSGVYNIIVTQGDNVKTLRVIKR